VVIALALLVSRSIVDPLRRLTVAASTTADLTNAELSRVADVEGVDERPPRLATIDIASGHEVGALAAAFNRVQATAAMLLERQLVSRRNVSLMFANVAQRTQNLVTRQITLVDRLERDEQNAQILDGLYQIDHISARLRRTSENLLVIAGARDHAQLGGPATLADVVRSALAEIEEYRRVRFSEPGDVVLAPPLVSDLVLVLAELLENATGFSPPQSFVDVHASQEPDQSYLVRIVDHGIGMDPQRLLEENHRLVERERLDVAPTRVLGLFVVGRLARRHGLHVALAATPHGGITATVGIPRTMIIRGALPTGSKALRPMAPVLELAQHGLSSLDSPGDGFSWFFTERVSHVGARPEAAADPMAVAEHPMLAEDHPDAEPGLSRRVPGSHQLPTGAAMTDRQWPPGPTVAVLPPARDAASVRTAMDEYQSAVGRASGTARPMSPIDQSSAGSAVPSSVLRDGLARRVPGANLAPGLRDKHSGAASQADDGRPVRDAESSRAAFDGYVSGVAKASADYREPHQMTSAILFDEGEHE
jgi:signal transduction histidine kinase